MANETIRVIAKITALPDRIEELRSVLLDLIGPTRAEHGCVSYQVCQSRDDPAEYVCVEEWSSAEAIDIHMKTPHVQGAFAKAGVLLAKTPEIRSYSIIG